MAKKVLAFLGLMVVSPSLLLAGGVGTTAAQFLKIGVGARPLAMGSAYVAAADDIHSLYWNPAGAALLRHPELGLSYNNLYQDTNQGFFGYAHPTDVGTFGLALDYLQVASIQARQGDTASPDYYFTSQDSALFLSYARPHVWMNGLSLGGSFKYITSHLDSAVGNAYAGDFGALYRCSACPLTLGVALRNVGTQLTYVSAPDPLPADVQAGLSYGFFGKKLLAAASVDDWYIDQRTYENFGLEWLPTELMAIRGGYQYGHGQDQLGSSYVGVSGGIGFRFKLISIDYAYLPFGDLGNTQRFSLVFRFIGLKRQGQGEEEPRRVSNP